VFTSLIEVPNQKFHEIPSSGRRAVPCEQKDGWMDGHGGINSHFSQLLCELLEEGND
jgi:hypothetical protein